MTEAGVGVGVVNYNTAELLRNCLESIVHSEAPVVVVDSASTDGSVGVVRASFPQVRLLALQRNVGFGAAANIAVRAFETPHVLLLNADTVVPEGAAAALARYLEAHPRVAVVGPRLVGTDGRHETSAHPFPTPLALLLQESGALRRLRHRHRERETGAVDWVLGAALAIRRESFDAVGGFDESYFMYQEEVDLCHRLREAGWEVHYAPVATVVHHGGASTGQREAEMIGQFARSTVRFARQRLGGTAPLRSAAVLAAVFVARTVRDAARLAVTTDPDRRRSLRTHLAGWRAGLRGTLRS